MSEQESTGDPAAGTPAAVPEQVGGLVDWAVPGVTRPAVEPRPLAPSAAVAAAQAAIAVLAGCPAAGLSPDQAIVDLAALLAMSAQLARVRVDRLADAAARSLHALDGARSAATWIATHGEVAPAELKVARRLTAFPAVGTALLTGVLTLTAAQKLQAALCTVRPHLDTPTGPLDGTDTGDADTGHTGDIGDTEAAVIAVIVDGVRMAVAQARGGFPSPTDPVLTRLLTELPRIAALPLPQLTRLEHALVLLAQHVEPAQLPGALDLLIGALLPTRLEDAAELGHQRRSLTLTRDSDGTGWTLSGRLDLLTGERLTLALDAGMRQDPDNVLDTATAEQLRQHGHDPYDPALAPRLTPRTRPQRRHDALNTVLTSYLAADLAGTHDKNPVQIIVTLTLPTLDGQPGALPARTSTGTLLPRTLWTSLACTAGFTRHLLTLPGKVIETSHTSRTLKAHERRALHTQTGGTCQGAGCTQSTRQPGTILHPHHTNPWSHCGSTSLDQTAHVCDNCHTHLHHGHPLRLKDGRLLGPDGFLQE